MYSCSLCIVVYHRCDVRLRLWASGARSGSRYKIPRLSEARAIDEGADLLGELFLFSVAVGECHAYINIYTI